MKTINTIRIVSLVALFAIFTNVASANSAAFAVAKKNLNETIQKTIKSDFKKVDNFLYENEINRLNEVVKVIVKVDDSQELKLIKAECRNCEATEYLKNVFSKYHIKADPILTGKYFQVDVHLIYRAI